MSNVGLQLYTLRDHFNTRAEVVTTLKTVREIGYESVQFFQVPLPVEEMRLILTDLGLSVCGVDVPLTRLEQSYDQVLEEMHILGCRYITYSYGGDWSKGYISGLDDYIRAISAIGHRLKSSDCRFAYHNHSFELVRYEGKPALQYFYEQTESAGILAEIDTYWIQHGGGDPAAWIRRYTGHVPLVHLKDLAMDPDKGQVFAEVGSGNMNWASILRAAADSGVDWLVVEQDICAKDPFESIAESYNYLADALGR
jgi:sugar phosphate isomerase/epimerase